MYLPLVVPGTRIPLANPPFSTAEMLALFCFIEGLPPSGGVNLDAPIDYGDVIMFDPAPVSQSRDADGNLVPCFPILEVLRRGDEHRMRFIAYVEREDAFEAFSRGLPEGFTLFRQSERIESARPSIFTGEKLEKPVAPLSPKLAHGKIVAPANADLTALEAYLEASPFAKKELAFAIPALYEKLGKTKRAGQEHQAYRGIERKVERRAG